MTAAVPAQAQRSGEQVPRLEEAEAIFEQALEAFQDRDYAMAFRRFRLVYEAYPLHRKTTAALLMGGKALYRGGEYQQAVDLLEEFILTYPTSGYLDEAEQTLDVARRQLDQDAAQAETIQLGIALPLNDQDAALTQELFNGIRLAVDAHNETRYPPVRMVFRDTRNTPNGARQAVTSMVGEAGVDVVLGPLYSAEAEAAAGVAERQRVVLVAPLATEEGVSRRRRYVFQANPTITARGALMARLAVDDLGLRTFGIVTAPDRAQIGERMAEGFQQEALRLGARVAFFTRLPDDRSWGQLPDQVGLDLLASVDAIYLPISGGDAHRRIRDALGSLDGLDRVPRVLGNSQWHGVPFAQQANAFAATYSDDFYVDEAQPAVQDFQQAYRALAGDAPGRLAYVGYDVTRLLLDRLAEADDAPLAQRLREGPPYEGLGTRIDFQDGQANEALFFLRYRNDGVVLLR